jgi:hypothetical protein
MDHQPELTRRCFLAGGAALGATLLVEPWDALAAPPPASGPTAPTTIVAQWNSALLDAISVGAFGAPIVARAIAITHTCMFDAWAAYDATAVGTRLRGSLRRPAGERTAANKHKAVSYAAYVALSDLYPDQQADFKARLRSHGYDPADAGTDSASPSGIGIAAAKAVIAFRHADGANQLGHKPYSDTTHFHSPNTWNHLSDPNLWQPLRLPDGSGGLVVQKYLGPHWGNVIPFALSTGQQFRSAVPAPYRVGQREFVAQAKQILHYGAQLNDFTKSFTEYWADPPGTPQPPGHWGCTFGQYISARDRHDLDADVKMFFLVGNALLDAGIACWDVKRLYDSVRPVTAIPYLFRNHKIRGWNGNRFGLLPARLWRPFQPPQFLTPPFPEYPSGHSTFSAASAEVLKRFTGSDRFGFSAVISAGTSTVEPNVPRHDVRLSYPTFSAASDQAGVSRRYGGYHFTLGDLQGRRLGRLVGAAVFAKAQVYFNGSA